MLYRINFILLQFKLAPGVSYTITYYATATDNAQSEPQVINEHVGEWTSPHFKFFIIMQV